MKKIYLTAWILLTLTIFTLAFTGTFNPAALVAVSLVALGLVFSLALWSVTVNTENTQTG